MAGGSPLAFMLAGPGRLGGPCGCPDGGAALAGHRVHAADLAGRRGRPARHLSVQHRAVSAVEIVWPNILGTQFEGNNYWGGLIHLPGARPKAWVPSLYLGGLTFVLALSSLTFRHGPPWRVWFTVIVVVSLLAKPGPIYQPDLGGSRGWPSVRNRRLLERLLPDLGPIDPVDDTPIRQDGYLRDGDGGFYWCLTNLLPGFRQFRFPAKLFTFTAWVWPSWRARLGPCSRAGRTRRRFAVLAVPVLTRGRTGGGGLSAKRSCRRFDGQRASR